MVSKSTLKIPYVSFGFLIYCTLVGFTFSDSTIGIVKIDIAGGYGNYDDIITDQEGKELRADGHSFFDGGISLQGDYGAGIFIVRVGTFSTHRTTSISLKANDPNAETLG